MRRILFWICVLFLVPCVCLGGCESKKSKITRYIVVDPLSEDEIIDYVHSEILKETGDDTIVKIVKKENLSYYHTVWFDGPIYTSGYSVIDGHEYSLSIQNKEYPDLVVEATYHDGYEKKEDERTVEEYTPFFWSKYKEKREEFLLVQRQLEQEKQRKEEQEKGFAEALAEGFDTYYLYKDASHKGELVVFLYSEEYEKIAALLKRFVRITSEAGEYSVSVVHVYIFKDKALFVETHPELFPGEGEQHPRGSVQVLRYITGRNAVEDTWRQGFVKEVFDREVPATVEAGETASPDSQPVKENLDCDFVYVYWYIPGDIILEGDVDELMVGYMSVYKIIDFQEPTTEVYAETKPEEEYDTVPGKPPGGGIKRQ